MHSLGSIALILSSALLKSSIVGCFGSGVVFEEEGLDELDDCMPRRYVCFQHARKQMFISILEGGAAKRYMESVNVQLHRSR